MLIYTYRVLKSRTWPGHPSRSKSRHWASVQIKALVPDSTNLWMLPFVTIFCVYLYRPKPVRCHDLDASKVRQFTENQFGQLFYPSTFAVAFCQLSKLSQGRRLRLMLCIKPYSRTFSSYTGRPLAHRCTQRDIFELRSNQPTQKPHQGLIIRQRRPLRQ